MCILLLENNTIFLLNIGRLTFPSVKTKNDLHRPRLWENSFPPPNTFNIFLINRLLNGIGDLTTRKNRQAQD